LPFGTQAADGRRSDEICPGQTWTYTYHVTAEAVGAWPFHDHCRDIGLYINRGLFGGLVVLPDDEHDCLPRFPYPEGFLDHVNMVLTRVPPRPRPDHAPPAPAMPPMAMAGMRGAGHPMPSGPMPRPDHPPPELEPWLSILDEIAHAPHAMPPKEHCLHVPLFLHQMSGYRGTPVFQSAPMNAGGIYTSPPLTIAGSYRYICGVHGASMAGTITVAPGGPSNAAVSIVDFAFNPPAVTIGPGGTVVWTNVGPSQHSVVEQGGDALPSYCLNGRSFVGNTPTILAHAGQKVRWYVFNLDFGMTWHNFHPHAQRWKFGGEEIDVRSIGPAESFAVETEAPTVLLLPPGSQHLGHPHAHAEPYHLRGDFLVHCHVEMHMMAGLAGLVRSQQTVYLTKQEKAKLEQDIGLALDPGTNDCPAIDMDRCKNAVGGAWEELPWLPEVTFMHAVLLPNSNKILFWGYGPRPDQARLWDQDTGLYTQPNPQPQALTADENIWSGAHAHLSDTNGTIILYGGFYFDTAPPKTVDTERRAFTFDPTTLQFAQAADVHTGRFYPTTITMPDGRAMTLFGQDNAHGGITASSLEIYALGGSGGSWSAPKPIPFNYFYYPWTFQLPGGDLFVAGPQKPSRRFDPNATPIVDDPARQYMQIAPQRGVNMDGTAVLLPLKPPHYEPRVLVAGGTSHGTNWSSSEADAIKTAEWIDLSVANPVWQALPDMAVERCHLNSVLLPDGRVLVLGGYETPPDGGPVEIFDPEDPAAGFLIGPNMKYPRGYHSSAILMPDGSVIMGGDPNGGNVPNECYLPSYFFKPRPAIMSSPTSIAYGVTFAIGTATPGAIGEVVLMAAGAVTHGFNQNQRYVGCAIVGTTATQVQVAAPPDGTVVPPGYYLLFLVDRDRVPSMAAWIRLA
jgi:plastocyanin